MELKDARINMLVNSTGTTIELIDKDSYITFAVVELTPAQLSSALGRVGHTECKVSVFGLDKIGKTHECKDHEFEIPEMDYATRKDGKTLHDIALKTCPDGWEPDNYYSSQNSFFTKDGKPHARCVIRRWV